MIENKYILAIETSCDDTSLSILKNNYVLSCISICEQKKLNTFGGIVPEIVARYHEKNILKVLNSVLKESKIKIEQINEIAFTNEPGLVGSLFVGEIFAKTLSSLLNINCYGINHIHGHILSPFINSIPTFPYISLIASGKTTSIFIVKSPNEIIEVCKTVDDAIGEVFDKIGKQLDYPYPGGPWIDKNFDINKATIKFKTQENEKNFSFSGIKNKVINLIKKEKESKNFVDKVTIGSSFMKWSIDLLIKKIDYFSNLYGCKVIAIGGGVAANSYFQSEIKKIFSKSFVPKKKYSTDNAAMIGYAHFLKKYI